MNSRLPDALTLDKHLDACTVPELSEFLRFWGPHERRKNGRRDALVEKLRKLMADENIVYGKVDLLSEKVRDVLLGLLRKTHYVSDLQGLFRGVESLDMEHYEAEAALTALSKRGFVRISRAEWINYGRSTYSIPIEIALVMRGLAGVDSRPLEQVFSRDGFQNGGAESEAPAEIPESVTKAVAELPSETLKAVASEALERFGGIITRHEFVDVFGDRGMEWHSAEFLREFGRAGLGTVGHLDLRAKAIGVDDDALFLFHEAVERYAGEWRKRPPQHDRALGAHGDLMSDVRAVLRMTGEFPIRVAKEGAVYKAARARIAERLQFPEQPLMDRLDVAQRVIDIVRGLSLAVPDDDRHLALTEPGQAWRSLSLLDKLKGAHTLLMQGGRTLRSKHLRGVHDIAVELLTGHEGWWPGVSLAMVARNRYLLDLARSDEPAYRGALTLRYSALTALGEAVHDLLVRDLFSLGLVEVAFAGGRVVALRLSGLGKRFYAKEGAQDGGKALIVNPDFEMLVLPEGDVDDLLHELDRYARRTKSGEVVHYQLDKRRVERASVAGETADDVIALLERHSRSPLPQNVIYSIRSWASDVRTATLERGVLFRASDPGVVEAILNHAGLRDAVLSVVDATTLFFDPEVNESQIAQELRALGVYPR
ncbi:MAG: helicase-associated domain-containing protein [Planctomycetota bacterium]|jgi:hypothetical protein